MTNDNQWNSEPPFQGQSNPPQQNPGSEQRYNAPPPPNQAQGQFGQQQSPQFHNDPNAQQQQQQQQQYQSPQFQNGVGPGGYPPPTPNNNNKLWIILGSVVVAVIGLGIAAFFLIGGMLGGDADNDKASDVKPTQGASQSATSKPTEDYIPVPDKIEDKEIPVDSDSSPYPDEWSSPAIKDYKTANGTTDDDFTDLVIDKLKHENGAITSSEVVSIPKNICYALDNGQTVNQVFINWIKLGQDQSVSSSVEDLGYNIGVLSAAGAMTYCPDHLDAIKKAAGQ